MPDTDHWPKGTSLLHVIAQGAQHDPAAIIGTAEGLEELCRAIIRALETGESQTAGSMAKDGEHFQVAVIPATTERMSEAPFGYTDPDINAGRWPKWLTDAAFKA